MRILLVSYYFPPFNIIASLRAGKWAKYLLKDGHDVRVVAAYQPTGDLSQSVEIPLERITYATNLKSIQPNRVPQGTNAPSKIPLGVRIGAKIGVKMGNPVEKFLAFLSRHTHITSDQWRWASLAIRKYHQQNKKWKPDIIIGSYSPPVSLHVASVLSRQMGVPWVADFRDLWADNAAFPKGRLLYTFLNMLERMVVWSASAMITVSEPLADILRSKYSHEIAVIYNGYDPEDFFLEKQQRNNRKLQIEYFGILYPQFRTPELLFRTLATYPELQQDIELVFYGSQPVLVHSAAVHAGLESNQGYTVCPRLPYKESIQRQVSSDLLLFIDWQDPNAQGIVAGKIFEYLGAKRQVLCLATHESVVATLIRQLGVGRVCTTTAEVAQFLVHLIHVKKETGQIPPALDSHIEAYTRSAQVNQLVRLLQNVCNRAERR